MVWIFNPACCALVISPHNTCFSEEDIFFARSEALLVLYFFWYILVSASIFACHDLVVLPPIVAVLSYAAKLLV